MKLLCLVVCLAALPLTASGASDKPKACAINAAARSLQTEP